MKENMMEQKSVNLTVDDGAAFFSNEASINFNPMQFFFDFKAITPRVDMRSKDTATIAVNHNVIVVDPFHAKQIHELMGTVLKKYEEEFGEIKKPAAIEKLEKNLEKSAKKESIQTPIYFG